MAGSCPATFCTKTYHFSAFKLILLPFHVELIRIVMRSYLNGDKIAYIFFTKSVVIFRGGFASNLQPGAFTPQTFHQGLYPYTPLGGTAQLRPLLVPPLLMTFRRLWVGSLAMDSLLSY